MKKKKTKTKTTKQSKVKAKRASKPEPRNAKGQTIVEEALEFISQPGFE